MAAPPINFGTPTSVIHGSGFRATLDCRREITLAQSPVSVSRAAWLFVMIVSLAGSAAHAAGANLAWNACLSEGGASN